DKIKQHIVWWEEAAKPPQLLTDGEVAMTSAFNGRVYDAMINDEKPLVILWNTQIWDLDFWGIPKGAKNQKAVLEFVKFATGTRPLAESTNYISYGPLRKSSARHVNPAVLPHLPTAPKNIENALRFDSAFWGKHREQLGVRFEEWLAE
ncbi:MAG: extracellular solute-binding protein, partial [Gammaproteobacteria bacterium]